MRIQWINKFTRRAHEFCQFTYVFFLGVAYWIRYRPISKFYWNFNDLLSCSFLLWFKFVLSISIVTNKFNMLLLKHIVNECGKRTHWRCVSTPFFFVFFLRPNVGFIRMPVDVLSRDKLLSSNKMTHWLWMISNLNNKQTTLVFFVWLQFSAFFQSIVK